jgi:hypothetical protein
MTYRMKALTGLAAATALLAGAAIADAAVTSGSYSGTTSERIPVTLTVSAHALKNLKTQIGYNGKCGQGGGPPYTIDVGTVALKSNGSFSETIVLHSFNLKAVKNRKAKLTGKASGSTVHGTIAGQGFTFNGCNGYTETFTASKR